MRTIVIDVINDKVIKLLQDLEMLQLIRVHKQEFVPVIAPNKAVKYKGLMKKQPLEAIDKQLDDLRSAWE